MSLKLKNIGLFAALALMLASCSTDSATGEPTGTTSPSDPGPLAAPALEVFDACDSFLDYVKIHAIDRVGPYGLDETGQVWWGGRMFAEDGAEEATTDTTAAGGETFSGTNVQVLGVDEPDIVKTDGERIVVLSEGTLIVADVTGDEPVITGRLHLGSRSVESLFLAEDRVLLFGSLWTTFHPLAEADAAIAPQYQSPSMELVEVDISGDPQIVRSMTIDGRLISGRMVGDTIRLVSSSGPVGL